MRTEWTTRCGLMLAIAVAGCSGDQPKDPDAGDKSDRGRQRFADGGARVPDGGLRVQDGGHVRNAADASGADAASATTDRDSATGDGGAATCANSEVTATRVTPSVMLLLDGSGSMAVCYGPWQGSGVACPTVDAGAAPPPLPAGTISRWDAIRDAVIDPTKSVVATHQDRVRFGVAVFGTVMTCPLPLGVIHPVLNNAAEISNFLPALPPGQFTPTAPALAQVVDILGDPQKPADSSAGAQIVVLVTDGDPNGCEPSGMITDYEPSIKAALKLQAKRQRMFVIGVGDEVSKMHLQEIANLGAALPRSQSPGAEVFYPGPDALAAGLARLIDGVLSCDLSLSGEAIADRNACKGTVMLDGALLVCGGDDGWVLKDEHHITLRGAACEAFKSHASASVRVEFPCVSQ